MKAALALVVGGAAVLCSVGSSSLTLTRRPTPQLITNEYAHRHHRSPDAVRSPDWIVTSGSLYRVGHLLWSGRPDDTAPGPRSAAGTGSAVLRAVTTRADLRDVRVRFALRVVDLVQTGRTPAKDHDGVHVFLRYQSEGTTYYASVYRRDGRVVLKRKNGVYTTLATATVDPSPAGWRQVEIVITGHTLTVRLDGRLVLAVLDDDPHAPPITAAGRVGLRGDNCEFYVRDFTVEHLT